MNTAPQSPEFENLLERAESLLDTHITAILTHANAWIQVGHLSLHDIRTERTEFTLHVGGDGSVPTAKNFACVYWMGGTEPPRAWAMALAIAQRRPDMLAEFIGQHAVDHIIEVTNLDVAEIVMRLESSRSQHETT